MELLSGKDANNGVYLCDGEQLLEAFTAPNKEKLDEDIASINSLAENTDIPVYFALIPSASEFYGSLLPTGTPNDSQKELIDYAYSSVSAKTVDIYSALHEHLDEEIFYRTDHHWTTLGAYYGYTAVAEAMCLETVPLSDYSATVVTDSFLGTTWSSSGFSWVEPESITTYVEQGDAIVTNYPKGAPTEGSLYVESFLEVKDKYSYFYGGTTPLLTIETGNEDAPSLLIIRDSYMDSMSPFLFEHFSTIHIIDLRWYKLSLNAYIQSNDIDNILVCYSVPNFSTDRNIFMAAF